MNRPIFSFRPNPENLEHRKAWEVLRNVPEGQKNAFLVQAILQEDLASRLEGMIRRTVREELKTIRLDETSKKTVREDPKHARLEKTPASENRETGEGKIPEQMLDFLSRME